MANDDVLRILLEQEGAYLSGESISNQLGVSRSAVWKSISILRNQGYHIASTPNKGYALQATPDRLIQAQLQQLLHQPQGVGCQLICLEEVDSTNTHLNQLALQGAPHGTVVTAETQTAGRGRRGRSFHSPQGTGLYCSTLLRPSCSSAEIANLTAWVAVALSDAIAQCCNLQPEIKWTNDLVLQGKKICGILTELGLESESDSVDYVVVGCGINVNQTKADFPQEIQSMATSLAEVAGKPIQRTPLCAAILTALNQMFLDFPTEKETYLNKYRNRCITLGKEIQVTQGSTHYQAIAQEIDQDFRLVVQDTQGETRVLSTGEVSVRGMYGYI